MAVLSDDMGGITAYAAAVNRGYTGTKEEFEQLMYSYTEVAERAEAAAGNAHESEEASIEAKDISVSAKNEAVSARDAAVSARDASISAKNNSESARDAAISVKNDTLAAKDAVMSAKSSVDETSANFSDEVTAAISDVNAAGRNQKELAKTHAVDSEAWAVGQREGADVGVSDTTYHNNSKYYAEQSALAKSETETARDTAITAKNNAVSAKNEAETARGQAQEIVDGIQEQSDQIQINKEDISDLKSELTQILVSIPNIEQGSIENGAKASSTLRLRTKTYISVEAGDLLRFVPNGLYVDVLQYADAQSTSYSYTSGWKGGNEEFIHTFETSGIVWLIFANADTYGDSTTIVVDDFTSKVEIVKYPFLYYDTKNDIKGVNSILNAVESVSMVNALANVSFETGSLDPTSGLPTRSRTRIRSEYIDITDARTLSLSVANGYKYALYFYSEIGVKSSISVHGNYYEEFNEWRTDDCFVFIIPTLKYAKVLIADTSDSTSISVDDADKVILLKDGSYYRIASDTDADIDVIKSAVNDVNNTYSLEKWSNGIVDTSIARINSSSTRIWSGVIDYDIRDTTTITAASGYQVAYYLFDANFNLLESHYWYLAPTLHKNASAKYYVIGLSKANSSSILPSEGATGVTITRNTACNYQSLSNITGNIGVPLTWEIGSLNPGSGSGLTSTNRIRSSYLLVGKGTRLVCDADYKHLIYVFDLNKVYVSDLPWSQADIVVTQECYIRILLCKKTDATITSEEVATIAATEAIYRAVPQSSASDLTNSIPTYYKEQLDTALPTIRENIFNGGINSDSFIFITDIHWQTNARKSPSLVKYIFDNTNVDKIISGGDLIGGGAKAVNIKLMSDCVDNYKGIGRFYSVFGNHDMNTIGASSDDYFTKEQAYALMQKQSDFSMVYGEPCYFYFDNPTAKTRYICLDTGLEGSSLSSAQSQWLSGILDGMPTGYHAIVFAHIIYQSTTTWHVGLTKAELAMTSFMTNVCTILDSFNANNNDKKVEAIIGGHVHIDCDFSTTGGIPIVLTDCDTRQTFTETSTGSGTANHALGTVNEQCFDVVTIDYTAKTIKCVRIGRGADRTITY